MQEREYIESLILDYWADSLPANQRNEVAHYLEAHPDFAREQQDLHTIWEGMSVWEDEHPSEQLSMRFDAMLNAFELNASELNASEADVAKTPTSNLISNTPSKPSFGSLLKQIWQYKPNWGLGLQMGLSLGMLLLGLFIGKQFWSNPVTIPPNNSAVEVSQLRGEVDNLNRQMAMGMLQEASANERLQGIDRLRMISQPNDEMIGALVQTLDTDPNINVRLAAVEALSPLALKDSALREQIKQLLVRQDSPMVQAMLVELMVQAKEKSSAQLIEKVIEKTPDANLREHFAQSIKALE